MAKVINTVSTILVTLVVILALLLVAPRFFGIDTYVVISGSMEPEFKTGGLIYTTKKVDPANIEIGDAITFKMSESTIATHRVIDIVDDNGVPKFQTKGDANEAPDANLVPYENVIGRALFDIPYLGRVANYIQNPPGLYFAAAGGVILILLVFMSDMLIEDDKKTKKKGKKPQEQSKAKPKKAKKKTQQDMQGYKYAEKIPMSYQTTPTGGGSQNDDKNKPN